MRITRGRADDDHARQYSNGGVRDIATAVLRHVDYPRLIPIASRAMVTIDPAPRAVLRTQLGGDPPNDVLDSAEEIARRGAEIARLSDDNVANHRRASVLERIVLGLVGRRVGGAVGVETWIELTDSTHSGKSSTGKKDVVVDAPVFEVYECKFSGGIEQWELNELGDVWLTARVDPSTTKCVPCVATMGTEDQIRKRIARLAPDEVLFFATAGNLAVLAERPSSDRLR
jgi:hypothetical protein